jgi:hypothetical protein
MFRIVEEAYQQELFYHDQREQLWQYFLIYETWGTKKIIERGFYHKNYQNRLKGLWIT